MFVDLQASFKSVLSEWAKEKETVQQSKSKQERIQTECKEIQKQFQEFVQSSNKSMIEKETANVQLSDQVTDLNKQLEEMEELKKELSDKKTEVEGLQEYKRRTELQ